MALQHSYLDLGSCPKLQTQIQVSGGIIGASITTLAALHTDCRSQCIIIVHMRAAAALVSPKVLAARLRVGSVLVRPAPSLAIRRSHNPGPSSSITRKITVMAQTQKVIQS
jgi:hypothetical protein